MRAGVGARRVFGNDERSETVTSDKGVTGVLRGRHVVSSSY